MITKIRYIFTDGENKDFILLCGELDNFLNMIAGGEAKRAAYIPHNRRNDIHDVVLAYDGQIAVGCAAFKRYDAYTAEVKRVFVREAYRGRGISEQLLKRLEKRAVVQGYTAFRLESGEPLIAAMGLYRKMGYQLIPNYGSYADMSESVCMEKKLAVHTGVRIEETKRGFEESFAQGSFYERQTRDDDHLRLLLELSDGENVHRILDLGTGTGYLALPMAKRWSACQVYGLDIVEETLARNAKKASGLGNCHFCAYDGIYFPFEGESFDRVVSRYALHHFPEIERTFEEIGRVLKAGGWLVLSDPMPNSEDAGRFVDRFMQMKPDGHIRFYTIQEWVRLAGQAGLRLTESVETSITFPRQQADLYETLLRNTPKSVLESYGVAVRGDEIYITERVANLVFQKI